MLLLLSYSTGLRRVAPAGTVGKTDYGRQEFIPWSFAENWIHRGRTIDTRSTRERSEHVSDSSGAPQHCSLMRRRANVSAVNRTMWCFSCTASQFLVGILMKFHPPARIFLSTLLASPVKKFQISPDSAVSGLGLGFNSTRVWRTTFSSAMLRIGATFLVSQ